MQCAKPRKPSNSSGVLPEVTLVRPKQTAYGFILGDAELTPAELRVEERPFTRMHPCACIFTVAQASTPPPAPRAARPRAREAWRAPPRARETAHSRERVTAREQTTR